MVKTFHVNFFKQSFLIFSGCSDVEQEILRFNELYQAERGPWRLPGVHPLPHDPGQRPDEGDPPTRNRSLSHHHERACLPGKVFWLLLFLKLCYDVINDYFLMTKYVNW